MPKMPPRPCTAPRCQKMAIDNGRCEDHKREAWQSSKGKSRHERGYGSKWYKLRDLVLKRDSYLCQTCLRNGIITQAKEVDHIKNKASGGSDSLDNLESICTDCHKKKTIKERAQ